jgi:hypothetical protein
MNANDCIPHLYPSPMLSDFQWCRVVNALFARNTKADTAIAMNLTRQLEEARERYLLITGVPDMRQRENQ